jgi:hypothetical protein
VLFQGTRLALNQLTSAESMTDSFPLTDFLKEYIFRIGKIPVPFASSGYNEQYYIDRIFNHNIFIRQDTLTDKKEEKFADFWPVLNRSSNSSVKRIQTKICIGWWKISQGNWFGSSRKGI